MSDAPSRRLSHIYSEVGCSIFLEYGHARIIFEEIGCKDIDSQSHVGWTASHLTLRRGHDDN